MGALDGLKKFYFSVEDKYYAFCDWLEKKGVKIYEFFVNPIEDRRLPSFPFFVVLLLAIVAGAAFLLSGVSLGSLFQESVATEITLLNPDGSVYAGSVAVKLSLEDGREFTEITKNGIARFEGLPKNAVAEVSLGSLPSKYSFDKKKIVLTGEAVALRLKGPSSSAFKVLVANENGEPIANALITFRDPESGAFQQASSNAFGEAEIFFSDSQQVFRLSVTAEGFDRASKNCIPSQGSCSVFLSSSFSPGGSASEPKGSVSVIVKDQQGNLVDDALVSLYNAGGSTSKISSAYTSGGQAFFQETIAVGTDVFVNIEADGFLAYYGIQENNVKTIPASSNLDFVITLRKKNAAGGLPSDYSALSVQVVDEDDEPIEDASVKLFLYNTPQKFMDEEQADFQGKAVFEVSNTQFFYATAFADGFLPQVSRQLRGGDATKLVLKKTAAGNNGVLEVKVKNADAQLVAGANVELYTKEGFYAGYPAGETDADGIAAFEEIASDAEYNAKAFYGSQSGNSDLFTVPAGETMEIEITLERVFAEIGVRLKNAAGSSDAFIPGEVKAFAGNAEIGSCVSPQTGGYCTIRVYALTPIVLKSQPNGFTEFVSEQMTLANGQNLNLTLTLMPSDLAGELQIIGLDLYPMDSSGSVVLDAENAAQALERGGWYEAKMIVSFPQAQQQGLYLRIGDGQSVAEEKAFISSFAQDETASAGFGTTYRPSTTCSDEEVQQSGSEFKWVEFSYASQTGSSGPGVKVLSAKIKVRPESLKNDKIDFHYRAFVVNNNLWGRVPLDAELGSGKNVAGKEYCFAETVKKEYAVTQGHEVCTAFGCVTLTLKSGSESAKQLSVPFGNNFDAEASVKTFFPESVATPVVKFTAGTPKYDVKTPVQNLVLVDAKGAVSTLVEPQAPSSFAPIRAEFYAETGLIAYAQAMAEVTGTGQLIATVSQTVIQVGLSPGDEGFKPLRVEIKTAQGKPVTKATLRIIETLDTAPFFGFPNGGDVIAGDNTENNGADGIYVLRLTPFTVGSFVVEASAGSDFAKSQTAEIQVISTSFLGVDPSDVLFNQPASCVNGGAIFVRKSLPVESQVYWNVGGADTQTQCVEVFQPSSSPFTIKKTADEKQVLLRPIQNGACSIAFTSTLPGTGSSSTAEASVFVECPNLTPLGEQICTDGTDIGECSVVNVGKRCDSQLQLVDDATCLQPPSSQACSDGTQIGQCSVINVGKRCNDQKQLVDDATCTQASTGGQCSASNCASCNEQQCLNYASYNFCTAVYSGTSFQYCKQKESEVSLEGSANCTRLPEDVFRRRVDPGDIIDLAPTVAMKVRLRDIDQSNEAEPLALFEILDKKNKVLFSTDEMALCETFNEKDVQIRVVKFRQSSSTGDFSADVSVSAKTSKDYLNDTCDPLKFDIGNLFQQRMGYLLASQALNPSQNQRAIAASASNQIVHSPNAPYFYVIKTGNGCTGGPAGLVCNKVVSPLVPVNGMAFSVQNAFGFDTAISVNKAGDGAACFDIQEVKSTGLGQIGDFLQNLLSGTLGVPGKQHASVVVLFKPDVQGCARYVINGDGTTELKPVSGKDSVTIYLSNPRLLNAPQFSITLKMKSAGPSKFGIASAPRIDSALQLFSRVGGIPAEPYLIANNINSELGVGSNIRISGKSVAGVIFQQSDTAYGLKLGSSPAVSFTPSFDKVMDSERFDVVGNAVGGGAQDSGEAQGELPSGDSSASVAISSLDECTGNDYCFASDELKRDVASEVSREFRQVIGNMDSISFTGDYAADKTMLNNAMSGALQDYVNSLANYQTCKSAGIDPLQSLRQKCSRLLTNPGEFGQDNAFMTGVGYAGCDSEVLGLATGASQAIPGSYGLMAGNLANQYLMPGTDNYNQGVKIFKGLNTLVNVPVKLAGANGGFYVYQFQPSETSLFDGTYNLGGLELESIVVLKGTHSLPLNMKTFSAKTGSALSTSTGSSYSSLAYLTKADASNEVARVLFSKDVNLFTMNKLGFQIPVPGKDEEIIATTFLKTVFPMQLPDSSVKVTVKKSDSTKSKTSIELVPVTTTVPVPVPSVPAPAPTSASAETQPGFVLAIPLGSLADDSAIAQTAAKYDLKITYELPVGVTAISNDNLDQVTSLKSLSAVLEYLLDERKTISGCELEVTHSKITVESGACITEPSGSTAGSGEWTIEKFGKKLPTGENRFFVVNFDESNTNVQITLVDSFNSLDAINPASTTTPSKHTQSVAYSISADMTYVCATELTTPKTTYGNLANYNPTVASITNTGFSIPLDPAKITTVKAYVRVNANTAFYDCVRIYKKTA